MSKQTVRAAAFANIHKITALLGVAATLPLAVLVTSNMLKYELGVWPGLQIPSIHPVILIGGVLVALMMNTWSILDVKVSKTGRGVRVVAEITAHRWNLIALVFACVFFVMMVLYLFVENVLRVIGA